MEDCSFPCPDFLPRTFLRRRLQATNGTSRHIALRLVGSDTDDGRRTDSRGDRARRAIGVALHVAAWFYLSVIAFLLGWVVLVWALMGWSPTVVSTGSMQPSINAGDVVMTEAADPDTVFDEGTVVTFEDPLRDGELVTHRVVAINDDGTYRTRGDGNDVSDSTSLEPEAVVGVGRLLIPSVALPRVWFDQGRLFVLGAWLALTVLAMVGATRVLWEKDPDGTDDAEH